MNDSSPRLFGSTKRTKYLVGVAMNGPIGARPLGRVLGIDSGSLPGLYRHFRDCGVVRRDDDLLTIDPDYPAFAELTVLLRALGGERVIVVPDAASKKAWPKRWRLFGSRPRTQVLIALGVLGSASLDVLRRVSGCSAATTRNTVDHFEAEGVLQIEREKPEVVVAFDERFVHAPLLRTLLASMANGTPAIRARAELGRTSEQKPDVGPAGERAAVLPIGTRVQSAVLVAVAHGPATTKTIAMETGLSRHTVRATLDALLRYGLVVTTTDGRGRGAARWGVLNERHPLAADIRCSAPSPSPRRAELPPKNLRRTAPVPTNDLPGTRELRTTVLLDVVRNGPSSPAAVAKRLAIPRTVVRAWAEDLGDAGLVRYGQIRGRTMIEPSLSGSSAAICMALLRESGNFRKRRRRGDRRDRQFEGTS